jgi:alpha-D-ribose 1-methylphosphonate 5-triphosphate diphosphatase
MLLTNLHLLLPEGEIEQGSLLIVDGKIAAISENEAPNTVERRVDCRGLIAMPGLIDIHGDMLEREVEPRPNARFPIDMALYELDKRLAGNGITTAYAALSFYGVKSDESPRSREVVRQMIQAIDQLRDTLLVEQYIHARYEVSTPDIAPFLAEMLSERQIRMVSLMDHTPGQGQYRNIEHYVTFISRWRKVDPAHVAAEVTERMRQAIDERTRWRLARDIVDMAIEQRLIIASHDDDSPEKVDLVASLGASICEFPVTMEAADEACRRGMHVVMGAPNVLRGGSHSGNLSALDAIAAGVVDLLAADYAPAAMVQAIFELDRKGILPLYQAARLAGQGPAAAMGLDDRGTLEIGKRADIALVEPGPRPRVRATLRQGRPIFWDGNMADRG